MSRLTALIACLVVAGIAFAGGYVARSANGTGAPRPCSCNLCDPGEDEGKDAIWLVYEPHIQPDGKKMMVVRRCTTARMKERAEACGFGSFGFYREANGPAVQGSGPSR